MATNFQTLSEISYRYDIFPNGVVFDMQSNTEVTQQTNEDGYKKVTLTHECGKRKTHSVHRLVACTYILGDDSLTVNHKDGVKSHNHYSNLQWATRSSQTQHAWDNKLIRDLESRKEGIRQKQGKPVVCTTTGEEWNSAGKAAEELGLQKSNISAVCLGKKGFKSAGKTEEGLPRKWRYKDDIK